MGSAAAHARVGRRPEYADGSQLVYVAVAAVAVTQRPLLSAYSPIQKGDLEAVVGRGGVGGG